MWTYSPTLAVIVGSCICVVGLWGYVWFDKERRSGKKYNCSLILMGRNVYSTLLAFLGLFLLDMVTRICFSSIVSFGSFARYALSAVILCFALGVILIVGSVFIAPTWKTLVVFLVMLGLALSITISSFSGEIPLNYRHFLYIPAIGIVLEILLDMLDFIHGVIKNRKAGKMIGFELATGKPREGGSTDPHDDEGNGVVNVLKNPHVILSSPLWNVSRQFKNFINIKTILVMFALFCLELILLFEGMSLLFWL